ncbi:MAG TPA: ATP-binding protein [Coxiellaceae bacterium]|nr:ATP-binding protein [Coxiellaceae bacterium]
MLRKSLNTNQLVHYFSKGHHLVIELTPQFHVLALNTAAQHWLECTEAEAFDQPLVTLLNEKQYNALFGETTSDYLWHLQPIENGYFLVGIPQNNSSGGGYSQIFLDTIVKHLPQYIFWKDNHSIYLGCNENYARLVGLHSPKEIVGKTDYDLPWSQEGDTAETFVSRDKAVLRGQPLVDVEQILSVAGGKKISVLINKVPIYDPSNRIIGILAVSADITEQKRIEQELMKAKEKAEIANRAKSDFIANMSHDFRTPLNAILGLSEALLLEEQNIKIRPFLEDIRTSGQVLLRLVDDVLNISQLEADNYPLHFTEVNIGELVNETLKQLKRQGEDKGLSFQIEFRTHPLGIQTDPDVLKRILINLVTNSLKFTETGEIRVIIDLMRDKYGKTNLEFVVSDTGIGIDPEYLDTIFERFTRIDPSYKGRHSGIGLGLNIVRQLVEALGGTVSVQSQKGQGSVFTCRLPVEVRLPRNQSLREEEPTRFQVLELPRDKCRILLVEDDAMGQRVAQMFLEKLGCEIDTVDSGGRAAIRAASRRYHLILMDIGLPDVDGLAVAEAIRESGGPNKDTPIIALTAHVTDKEKARCFEAGMDGFLSKPVTLKQLHETLASFVASKEN